jgi:hypothetical protein
MGLERYRELLKMSRKRKKRKSRFKGRSSNYSTIDQHHRVGKTLIPPMLKVPKLQHMSWMNERLPEMLWSVLLISDLPRSEALAVFRAVAKYISEFRDGDLPYDVTHTGLSKLEPETLHALLKVIVPDDRLKKVLAPLLVLKDLPARETWAEVLAGSLLVNGWKALEIAAAKTLYHQSQEATDCRWVRVICWMTGGKLILPTKELVEEILYYPEYGDPQKVRPTVRAMEGSLDSALEAKKEWPEKFWSQCLSDTPCFPVATSVSSASVLVGTTLKQQRDVYDLLIEHHKQTTTTSDTNPKHDTVFGTAFYSLNILEELLSIGASQSISARFALRTIAECYITLAYLAKKDDPELWKSYRVFGAGQAKLVYLKLMELGEAPTYVSAETLENLANEDVWQEFLSIDLGHWQNANLRDLSITAEVKDDYDRFYPWTSSFAHGHWAAVREAVYDTCGNALHRLHRVPRKSARVLGDALADACRLTDKILEIVSACYPHYPHRVTVVK